MKRLKLQKKDILEIQTGFYGLRVRGIYNNEYIPIKYELVDGIKTGYTGEAGNCLVSSGRKMI